MDYILGADEEDRRKTTTPRHHSQGQKKEDQSFYRNNINFTSKKEPVKMWPDHYSNQMTPYKPKYQKGLSEGNLETTPVTVSSDMYGQEQFFDNEMQPPYYNQGGMYMQYNQN